MHDALRIVDICFISSMHTSVKIKAQYIYTENKPKLVIIRKKNTKREMNIVQISSLFFFILIIIQCK